MRNDEILQEAIRKELRMEQVGEDCKSAFSVVHQCIRATDVQKRKKDKKKKGKRKNEKKKNEKKIEGMAGEKKEELAEEKIEEEMTEEEEKKEELIKKLQNFWRGTNGYIMGCKREQIQTIVKRAFGIANMDSGLDGTISSYTFQELYLYYCYIERIAQSSFLDSYRGGDGHEENV